MGTLDSGLVLACAGAVRRKPMHDAILAHRLIALVPGLAARGSLFLDIGNLAAGRYLSIAAGDAAARESRETEKSNQAHGPYLPRKSALQTLCR